MKRVCGRVSWTERRGSERLHETARNGRGGSNRSTSRVHHPQLHRTHHRAYERRLSLQRKELPETVDSDLIGDEEVTYIGTKACKVTAPKKRIKK